MIGRLPLYQPLLPDQDETDGFVDTLRCDLDVIARYTDGATLQNLEMALLDLMNVRFVLERSEHTLDDADTLFLTRAAILAHANLGQELPGDFNRVSLNEGMNAVQALIVFWSRTKAQRASYHKSVDLNIFDRMRILLNDIWTADLVAGINRRELERRAGSNAAIIKELKQKAVGRK